MTLISKSLKQLHAWSAFLAMPVAILLVTIAGALPGDARARAGGGDCMVVRRATSAPSPCPGGEQAMTQGIGQQGLNLDEPGNFAVAGRSDKEVGLMDGWGSVPVIRWTRENRHMLFERKARDSILWPKF